MPRPPQTRQVLISRPFWDLNLECFFRPPQEKQITAPVPKQLQQILMVTSFVLTTLCLILTFFRSCLVDRLWLRVYGGFRSNQNLDPGEQFLLIEAMDRVSTFREVFSF